MRHRLEQFYAAFGDKGVMFILYAFSVVVNSLLAMSMELPAVYPDEISVAGIAAFYSGRDWSALLEQIGGGYGYVQALVYAPLFFLIKNPYVLYKAMLIINGIMVSFIPLIVYHLAAKFGVMRVRYKLLIALCCGMYVSYISDSKYIWNESVTSLLVWVLVLCLFSAWDKKNRYTRFTMSVLSGFICAAAYAANTRMLAVVIALILTVLMSRLMFKEKIVNLPVFCVSLAVSFAAEFFARSWIVQQVWNGAEVSAEVISERLGPTGNFFGVIFSHLYAFMTSTCGMGALAAALTVILLYVWFYETLKAREKPPENGTRVYEPVKHKYGLRITIFGLFQFLAIASASVVSALFTFSGGKSAEDAAIFGRGTDNVAPLALFLVLVFVFLYGIDLKKLFFGAVIYGYACVCFAAVGYPLVSELGQSLNFPVPIVLGETGENASGAAPAMSYVIMSSCVFTLLALIIVFTSCSRKHRTVLISLTMLAVMTWTAGYSGIITLPRSSAESAEAAEPYKDVFRLLYNDPQSPPIIAYETEPRLAAALQFLAPDTRVSVMRRDGGRVPESCLLIAENGVEAPFEGGSYDMVGRTNKYTVYAYGESARDFIRYSSANEK